jgi:imidazolonepropionase-like amidohydrolase
LAAMFAAVSLTEAQAPSRALAPAVARFVNVSDSLVALTNVRLIDGTGRPVRDGQTILIAGERIAAVGSRTEVTIPPGARAIDLAGYTVIPGLVGLHDHMYYSSSAAGSMKPMLQSYPRLFLGAGVTTIRTTGSVDSYQELNLRKSISEGTMPGPDIVVTGPYLQGPGPGPGAMHPLSGADDAERMVRYWAEEGVTWFKAYTQVTRAELKAAIDEAHKHGVRVTGHLCSIGFREAVGLGIDNLEHGYLDDLEFFPGKEPDRCPMDFARRNDVYSQLNIEGPEVQATIRDMVSHGVSMTSTLAVIELSTPSRLVRDPRVLDALFPSVSATVDSFYRSESGKVDSTALRAYRKLMDFERAFVKAGGLLGAGSDPCCLGVIAGFGDQRNFELLVEAGFSPEQAVAIMTANGAKILRLDRDIGTVEAGKQADLVVVRGDLAASPRAIRDVVTVYRKGLGYDSEKLIASVKGLVGLR